MHSSTPSSNGSGSCEIGPQQALKTHMRYWRKWPKFLNNIFSFPAYTCDLGEFPMISDGERENSGLAYRCFCTICKHHPKMHSYSTTNHFGDIPERQWVREILPVDRISSTPGCSICLEEEMVKIWVYLDSWTVANCLAAFSWTWKEYNGKWMTREVWGKDMCVNLLD